MNDADRSRIEQRLIEERARVATALDRLDEEARSGTDDDGELSNYDQHPADQGTDTYQQEQTMALLAREAEALTTIDNALRVLYDEPETFGTCANCGRDIELERLDLVPWAQACAQCATAGASGAASERGAAESGAPRGGDRG
jgi:DnaK suppressor protein